MTVHRRPLRPEELATNMQIHTNTIKYYQILYLGVAVPSSGQSAGVLNLPSSLFRSFQLAFSLTAQLPEMEKERERESIFWQLPIPRLRLQLL